MHCTKGVLCRLETVGIAVNVFGLDGTNCVYDFLLHVRRPVGNAAQKLFEFVQLGALIVIEMGM